MMAGHRVSLYVYDEVAGVPDGVVLRDAAAIVPFDQIIRHHRTGSMALFSDRFRYELQRRGLGTWIDCDIYFLRPLDGAAPHLFGREDDRFINTAVLRLPRDSPLLASLLSVFDGKEVPFWLSRAARLGARWRRLRHGHTDVGRMPWGSVGPKALTALAIVHGLDQLAQPAQVFCPVSYRAADWIRDPARPLERMVGPRSVAVHLWNERIARFKEEPAPPGSFLHRLHHEGA